MLQRIKRLLHRHNQAFQELDIAQGTYDKTDGSKSVFEQLTDQLIDETIGQNGSMHQFFNRLVAGYDADTNPIGVNDARRILVALVGDAVERRKVFVGRIEKSVVEDGLFKRYYSSLQEINDLTVAADEAMQRMKRARDRYIYEAEIYRKLTGFSYVKEVMPTDEELDKARKELASSLHADDDVRQDIWNDLDYEGGEVDEPVVEDSSEGE